MMKSKNIGQHMTGLTMHRFSYPLLAAGILALAGCSQVGDLKKKVGLSIESPDEFLVQPQKPLQMPSSTALPVPQPGAKSLVAYDPEADARKAIFGDTAAVAPAASAGEADLLKSANATDIDPNIRAVVASESDNSDGQTYLFDSWFGKPRSGDPEDLLDPAAEAKRIQDQSNAGATE